MAYRLSKTEKWKLVATLLLLYYPVMLYIDLPVYKENGVIPLAMIRHEGFTIVVIVFIFYIWISGAEWVLDKLLQRFGEEFLLEFSLVAQAVAFLLAGLLGYAFVRVAGEVLFGLNTLIHTLVGVYMLVPKPFSLSEDFFALYARANIGFFLLIMLSVLYLIANRRAQLRIKESVLHTERLQKENVTAQLAALRSQVNPHFLFNTLNILSSLVREDSRLSADFINELSKFYRYTLDSAKDDHVQLRVEVEFIQSYLFLLRLRFGDKLKVTFTLSNDDLNYLRIAPLTLQLLIENAVKHNRMSMEEPLTIEIMVRDGYLVVSNNVQIREQHSDSTGVGLQNIMDRYGLLTPVPVRVNESKERFSVSLPLLK